MGKIYEKGSKGKGYFQVLVSDLILCPPLFCLAQNIFHFIIFIMHVWCIFCYNVLI